MKIEHNKDLQHIDIQNLDITLEPSDTGIQVEVQERPTGKVLYVHINGYTVLRVCRAREVNIIT